MSRTPELLCFGCVPLVQNERTNAYVRWAQLTGRFGDAIACCPSVTLRECPDDTPQGGFTDPITDFACWYNPDFPESADFLGLWIVDLDGLENDPYIRNTTEAGIDGTVFNRGNRPGRTLTFDVMLLASSCAGMEWGRDWVAKVLRGGFCSHTNVLTASCGTEEMKVRVCCPDEGDVDDGVRVFPSVATTGGLQRIDGHRRDQCCDVYRRYQFIVTTERANKYGEMQEACAPQEPSRNDIVCFDWDSCRVCNRTDHCICDPVCSADTCEDDFATVSLLDSCYCDPFERIRTCCCVPEQFAGQSTHALIIDLFAGDSNDSPFKEYGARNVEINVFPNPKNLPCPTTEAEYLQIACAQDPCASVQVAHIPAGSTLRLDGRTGDAFVVCNGTVQQVFDIIDGSIKNLVNECYPIMVCAQWDAGNVMATEDVTGPGYEASSLTVYAARDFG